MFGVRPPTTPVPEGRSRFFLQRVVRTIAGCHETLDYISCKVLLLSLNLLQVLMFDKKSLYERDAQVKSLASLFGNKFIVLPNSVYGDWEHALFQYKYDLPFRQKDSLLRASLKTQY
jgi:hypothetical protein